MKSNVRSLFKMILAKCVIPCLNGGKCRGANKCRCHSGYRGNHCEIESRVAQRSLCTRLCKHGICQTDNTCLCDPGWTGKKCQRSKLKTGKFIINILKSFKI